ncbi:MAG: hypothetical protein AAF542_19455 [Pseudomonadota bacterium]
MNDITIHDHASILSDTIIAVIEGYCQNADIKIRDSSDIVLKVIEMNSSILHGIIELICERASDAGVDSAPYLEKAIKVMLTAQQVQMRSVGFSDIVVTE